MTTDGDKRGEGWESYLQLGSWDKIVFFPIWFPFFLCATIFDPLGEGRKENQRLLKDFYKRRGFAPYAIELIVIGIIFLLIFLDMPSYRQERDRVISNIAGWALIIGVGYFLFKLLLVAVSKIAEAAKTGAAKASPPTQGATSPGEEESTAESGKKEAPDDLKTRLLRLEDLHNEGLLTDAEYQAKREEILGEV